MGKYRAHLMFFKYKAIRPYLPDTSICRLPTLKRYLHRFRTVYIKPVQGGQGRGVTKAWRSGGRYYHVLEKGTTRTSATVNELYRKLSLHRKGQHMVQRGIDLAKVNGRAYDIRLMMMRDRNKKWTYVGMLAKVAGNKSIITNVARGGGYALPIDTALRRSMGWSGKKISEKKREMIRLSQACNKAYNRDRYEWQIGYDLAVDRNGKVWLIEANPTVPSHGLFLKLKDKTIYNKIKRMAAINRKRKK